MLGSLDCCNIHSSCQTTEYTEYLLTFFSSRPNWDSPPPLHPQAIVFPLLCFRGGGVTLALGREREWGSLNSDEGTDTVVL
jgi:hypothetical protein